MMKSRLSILLAQKSGQEGRIIQQQELAEYTGIRQGTISAWMKRDQTITRFHSEIVGRLCKYFDCTVDELLELDLSDIELPGEMDVDSPETKTLISMTI